MKECKYSTIQVYYQTGEQYIVATFLDTEVMI